MVEKEVKKPQSLDDFLANHTSEDNESFDDIQEEAARRHRITKSWMYKVRLLVFLRLLVCLRLVVCLKLLVCLRLLVFLRLLVTKASGI